MPTETERQPITDDLLATHGRAVFTASSLWRDQHLKDRWLKDNDLYDGRFPPKARSQSDVLLGQGRLFIPKTYSHVQRILVDVLDSLYGDGTEFVDVTAFANVPAQLRLLVKTLLVYRCSSHPINLYAELYEACLDALKTKTGILKVYPRLTVGTMQGTDETGATTKNRVILDFEPRLECVPYEDMFFHPRATWKDYERFPIVHRFRRTLDEMRQMGYKNLDDLAGLSTADVDEVKTQRDQQATPTFSDLANPIVGQREVVGYEVWTFLDLDGRGRLQPCSFVMAGDAGGPSIVVKDVTVNDLPYAPGTPFVLGTAFPEPHVLAGKSLPEIVEGLQRETNALRNQRRESVALSLRKPLLVNRNANVDLAGLLNRRIGGVVQGDDISEQSVRELQVADATQGSIQEQMRTDQDFFETTGIPPNLMGAPSSPDETATAVTRHEYNANKKIAHTIRNLGQTLLLPAMKKLLALEKAYESDEFVAQIAGQIPNWGTGGDNTPTRESIAGEYDLTVDLGASKQQQLNRLMLLMDRANIVNQTTMGMVQAGVVYPPDAKFVSQQKIFERILPLVGEKNPADFYIDALPPPPPMPNAGAPPGVASQTGAPSNQGSPTAPTAEQPLGL